MCGFDIMVQPSAKLYITYIYICPHPQKKPHNKSKLTVLLLFIFSLCNADICAPLLTFLMNTLIFMTSAKSGNFTLRLKFMIQNIIIKQN